MDYNTLFVLQLHFTSVSIPVVPTTMVLSNSSESKEYHEQDELFVASLEHSKTKRIKQLCARFNINKNEGRVIGFLIKRKNFVT